nr:MAG TPA: hypothetical protein [Caudoviricetes sp.]
MKTVSVAHIFSAPNASKLAETAQGIASGKKRRGAASPLTRTRGWNLRRAPITRRLRMRQSVRA